MKKKDWEVDWEASNLGIDPKFLTNDDRFELARLLERIRLLPEEERRGVLLAFAYAQHQRQIEYSETMRKLFLESPAGRLRRRRSWGIRIALGIFIFALGYSIFLMASEGFTRSELVAAVVLFLLFSWVQADGITLSRYVLISFFPERFARKFVERQ